MTNFINFSAKDLCTRSCMQIKMFAEHPEKRPQPSQAAFEGESYQHQVVKKMNGVIGEEMGSVLIDDNVRIYFSNDVVCKDKIVEIKSVNGEPEEWYLKSSLLQCAVYNSLLKMTDGRLKTAKFFSDKGNPIVETAVDDDIKYFLKFGNDIYLINVKDAGSIVRFILEKAKASMSWDGAKLFDAAYKRKEFETLKPFFDYVKIDM